MELRFELLVRYCLYDNLPIEQSETYQSILKYHGKEFADQFTYEAGMQDDRAS